MKKRMTLFAILLASAFLLFIPAKVYAYEWDNMQPGLYLKDANTIEIQYAPFQYAKCTYDVYRMVNNGSWELIAQDTLKTNWKDDEETKIPGATYSYQIVKKLEDGSQAKSNIVSCKFIAIDKISLTNTNSGIKIKWNLAKGATSYRIYRWENYKWKRIKTLKASKTSTSYTDTAAKAGSFYMYKVVPYYNSQKGVKVSDSIYRIKAPKVTSVKTKNCKVTIKWKKVSKTKVYQIYYKVSGSKGKYVEVANSKLSYTTPKLKKGKKCYIKVRALRYEEVVDDDGEEFLLYKSASAWSKTKTLKVK